MLRAVASGATWVSGGVVRSLLTSSGADNGFAGNETQLTSSEQRVATLLARGWSNAQIATELNWTPQTVRNYISRIYHKLGANRSELIANFQQNLQKR